MYLRVLKQVYLYYSPYIEVKFLERLGIFVPRTTLIQCRFARVERYHASMTSVFVGSHTTLINIVGTATKSTFLDFCEQAGGLAIGIAHICVALRTC